MAIGPVNNAVGWYAPVGASLGNSWRIGPDDNNWDGVLKNIDIMNGLQKYAGTGSVHDVGNLMNGLGKL